MPKQAEQSTGIMDAKKSRALYILSRVNRMKLAKDEYSANWKRYEEKWKMFAKQRDGEDAWRATLPDTFAYATIKTAQSAFLDSDVLPQFAQHEDEDSSKAKDLQDLFSDIALKGDLKEELYFARLDAFKL